MSQLTQLSGWIILVISVVSIAAYLSNRKYIKPEPVVAPMPKQQEPVELSCFVKGIVKSMADEPDAWEMTKAERGQKFTHKTTGLCIERLVWFDIDCRRLNYACISAPYTPGLSTAESTAICNALGKIIDDRAERERAEAKEKAAPTIAHFERIGCPGGAE